MKEIKFKNLSPNKVLSYSITKAFEHGKCASDTSVSYKERTTTNATTTDASSAQRVEVGLERHVADVVERRGASALHAVLHGTTLFERRFDLRHSVHTKTSKQKHTRTHKHHKQTCANDVSVGVMVRHAHKPRALRRRRAAAALPTLANCLPDEK